MGRRRRDGAGGGNKGGKGREREEKGEKREANVGGVCWRLKVYKE